MLLLVLATLVMQKPGKPVKPVAALPPDSLAAPSWVLTGDHPKVGDVLEAWLVVRHYASAPANSPATLTLLPPATAKVWFRQSSESCSSSEVAGTVELAGAMARDTILFACVRPTDEGVLRLVAVRRALEPGGVATVQRIAVSDPLDVAPWFTLSPTLAAALSAIGGFLAGFLGHVIQQWWDARRAGRKNVKEMQAVVLKALVPELRDNQAKLQTYLSGSGAVVAPDLFVVGYNAVLGDAGVAAFLGEDARKNRYAALHKTYRKIKAYTDAKNASPRPAGEPQQSARVALAAIDEPLKTA